MSYFKEKCSLAVAEQGTQESIHTRCQSRIFSHLLRVVGIEKDAVLKRALQSQAFSKYKYVRCEVDDMESPSVHLVEFLKEVDLRKDLKSILIFCKAMLCEMETNEWGHDSFSNDIYDIMQPIVILDSNHFKSILAYHRESLRLSLFGVKRHRCIAFRCDSYTGADNIPEAMEVCGAVSGFISGLVATSNSGKYYFESKLRNPGPGLKIGWMSCSRQSVSSYTDQNSTVVESNPILGNDSESWMYDGLTGVCYTDADAVAALRVKKSFVSQDATHVESRESEIGEMCNSGTDKFASFDLMRAMGLSEGAIRQKMIVGKIPEEEIALFFNNVNKDKDKDDGVSNILDGLSNLFSQNEESCPVMNHDFLSQQLAEAFSNGGRSFPCIQSAGAMSICSPLEKPLKSWQDGDVVGCLLDTDDGTIRFFVNDIEQGTPGLNGVKISPSGICPAFTCSAGSCVRFKVFSGDEIPPQICCQNMEKNAKKVCESDISQSPCIALNQQPQKDTAGGYGDGYIISDAKLPTVLSPARNFTIEVSLMLSPRLINSVAIDSTRFFAVFSFSAADSANISSLLISADGMAVRLELFGIAYVSPPNVPQFTLNQWHHLRLSYTAPSTSSPLISLHVDDGKVELWRDKYSFESLIPGQVYDTECKDNSTTELENRLCVGGVMKYFAAPNLVVAENILEETKEQTSGITRHDTCETQVETASKCQIISFEKYGYVEKASSWIGCICDVRVWDNDFSAGAMKTCARDNITGCEKDLIVLWRFMEGFGRTLWNGKRDAVVIGAEFGHATLMGDVTWTRFDPLYHLPPDPLQPSCQRTENCDVNCDGHDDVASHLLHSVCLQLSHGARSLIHGACNNTKLEDIPPHCNFSSLQELSSGYTTVVCPHVLSYLLINSCLRQIYRILYDGKLSAVKNVLLLSSAEAMLNVLNVNIKVIWDKSMSVSSLGLKYAATSTGDYDKISFVGMLLATVMGFVGLNVPPGEEHAPSSLSLIYRISQISIDIITRGLEIFFPHPSDQVLLVECLLIKKHMFRAQFPKDSISKVVFDQFMSYVNDEQVEVSISGEISPDPVYHIFKLSHDTSSQLLDCVLRRCCGMRFYPNPDFSSLFISNLIPQVSKPMKFPENETNVLCSMSPVADDDILLPRIGDIVERGPHWRYGDEDGGKGKKGRVLRTFDWLGKYTCRGVTVQWTASNILNSYCYGVPEDSEWSTDNRKQYEISILRSSQEMSGRDRRRMQGEREKRLLYSPDEVYRSLVEEVGELTKRTVIRYMKSIAPMSWQKSRKLSWTENSIVGKLSGEELAIIYAEFYDDHSTANNDEIQTRDALPLGDVGSLSQGESESYNFLCGRLHRVLRMLLLDVESVGEDRALSNDQSVSSLVLLSAIQAELMGHEEIFPWQLRKSVLRIPSLKNCIIHKTKSQRLCDDLMQQVAPDPPSINPMIVWNWVTGTWEGGDCGDCESLERKPQIKHLEKLSFNKCNLPKNVSFLEEDNCLSQKSTRKWSTCLASQPLPRSSGRYSWTISVDNVGKRGHCIFGVGSAGVKKTAYLGSDGSGWGLTMNNEFFHNGSRVVCRDGSPMHLRVQSIMQVTIDTDRCEIQFVDLSNSQNFQIFPVHFDENGTLYPAFSLFTAGDTISFLSSKEASLIFDPPISITSHVVDKNKAQNSKEPRRCSHPPDAAVEFAIILMDSVAKKIQHYVTLESRLELEMLLTAPLCSFNLSHALACLYQWENISDHKLEKLSSSIINLLTSLNSQCKKLIMEENTLQQSEFRVEKGAIIECSKNAVENGGGTYEALCIAGQLSVLLGSYVARIVHFLIGSNFQETPLDHHAITVARDGSNLQYVLSKSERHNHEVKMPLGHQGVCLNTVLTWISSKRHDEKKGFGHTYCAGSNGLNSTRLKRDLGGICSNLAAELLTTTRNDVTGDNRLTDELLWTWLNRHEKPSAVRNIGGSAMARGCHVLFYALLYHGGLLLAISNLVCRLELKRGNNKELAQALQDSPPPVLVKIMKLLENVKIWAMHLHKTQSRSYENIGNILAAKSLFILELLPMPHIVIREEVDEGSSNVFEGSSSPEVIEIFNLIVSFVKQDINLPHVRVAMLQSSERARKRANGFNILSQIMTKLHEGHRVGWVLKICCLHLLPQAFGRDNPGALASPSRRHFLDGLELCTCSEISKCKGSFYLMYSCLVNELGAARERGERVLMLHLLNCLAIYLQDDDHNMLARVKIFHVLQDILQETHLLHIAAVDRTSHPSKVCQMPELNCKLESAGSTQIAEAAASVVRKVAMKLLYLLSIQIAWSNPSSPQSLTGSMVPPLLERTMSGPSTLSDVVFDMFYQQIQEALKGIATFIQSVLPILPSRCVWSLDCAAPEIKFLLSGDALMILEEATMLLSCVSSTPSCQHILAKGRWLILLLTLAYTGPTSCQHRALRVLANVLPFLIPSDLDTLSQCSNISFLHFPDDDVSESGNDNSVSCKYPTPAVRFVYKLLDICGKAAWQKTALRPDGYIKDVYYLSVFVTSYVDPSMVSRKKAMPPSPEQRQICERYPNLINSTVGEAVALLRTLLSSPSWAKVVGDVMMTCLTDTTRLPSFEEVNDLNICMNRIRSLACFGILGGHVDCHYEGSIVEIVEEESGQCTKKIGYVVKMSGNSDSDIIEVNLFASGNHSIKPLSDNVDSVKRYMTSSYMISMDQTRCLNRYPFNRVVIPFGVLENLLKAIFSSELLRNSPSSSSHAVASSNGIDLDEQKEETCAIEEKDNESEYFFKTNVPLRKFSANDYAAQNVLHAISRAASCKSLSSLLTLHPETCDILTGMMSETLSGNDVVDGCNVSNRNMLLSLLDLSVRVEFDGKSPRGTSDIEAVEKHLALFIAAQNALEASHHRTTKGVKDDFTVATPVENNSSVRCFGGDEGDGDNDNYRCMSPLGGASVSVSLADTNDARGEQSDSDSQMSSVCGEDRETRSISTTRSGRSFGSISKNRKKKGERYLDDTSLDTDGLELLTEEGHDKRLRMQNHNNCQQDEKVSKESTQRYVPAVENNDIIPNINESLPCQQGHLDAIMSKGKGGIYESHEMDDVDNDEKTAMVTQLEQMGFPGHWGEIALERCGYDLGEAISYILIHGETLDDTSLAQEQNPPENLTGVSVHSNELDLILNPLDNGREREKPLMSGGHGGPLHHESVCVGGVKTCPVPLASEENPKDYHYLGSCSYILPIYSDASILSEKIGAVFPGDDISAIEEIFHNKESNSLTTASDPLSYIAWLKVFYSDFCDDEEDEDIYVDDYDYDEYQTVGSLGNSSRTRQRIYAWIPTIDNAPCVYESSAPGAVTGPRKVDFPGSIVVVPGPTALDMSAQSSHESHVFSPRKLYPIRATLKVTGAMGAKVRRGVRIDSDEVGIVQKGATVSAIAESFSDDGVIRMHIVTPMDGWISKRTGLVEVVMYEALESLCDHNLSHCHDDGKIAEDGVLKSDIELFEMLDDRMEDWGGADAFHPECRFFDGFRGRQFCFSDVRTLSRDARSICKRFCGRSDASASKCLLTSSLCKIESAIVQLSSILCTLYCRKALLVICLKDVKDSFSSVDWTQNSQEFKVDVKPRALLCMLGPINCIGLRDDFHPHRQGMAFASQHQGERGDFENDTSGVVGLNLGKSVDLRTSHGTIICTARFADSDLLWEDNPVNLPMKIAVANFLAFVRLVLFRGEPFSSTFMSRVMAEESLEYLCLDDISAASVQRGVMRVESIFGSILSSFLRISVIDAMSRDSSPLLLLTGLLTTVARHLRLACNVRYAEHSWTEPYYADDTDEEALSLPNIHYTQFLSLILCRVSIITTHELLNIPAEVFKMWCLALKGSNMTLKLLSCNVLDEVLIMTFSSKMPKRDKVGLLKSYLDHLPLQRLRLLASHRLWYELEDQPAYSRYLAALTQLLAVVARAGDLIDLIGGESDDTSKCFSKHDGKGNDETKSLAAISPTATFDKRDVISFESSSSIQLSPCKEVSGSWTIEAWVCVSEKNGAVVSCSDKSALSNDSDNSEGARGRQSASARENICAFGGRGGALFGGSAHDSRPKFRNPSLMRENDNDESFIIPPRLPFLERSGDDQRICDPQNFDCHISHRVDADKSPFGTSNSSRSGPFTARIVDRRYCTRGDDERNCMSNEDPSSLLEDQRLEFESALPRNCCGQQKMEHVGMKVEEKSTPQLIVMPSYLVSSSSGFIKLQAGGLMNTTPFADALQDSDPVFAKALCVSVGPHGCQSEEKSFDYVIPVGIWTHLAFVYDRSCQRVSLIVDGIFQDSVEKIKLPLPHSVVGSTMKGHSFTGQLAEMRFWSNVRTPLEIKRDMHRDLSPCRALISLVSCSSEMKENPPDTEILDYVSMRCAKLLNCRIIEMAAPRTDALLCPVFMLMEPEAAEGVYGEGVGECHDVEELTGVLDFSGSVMVPYHLRHDLSTSGQVVCIGFRCCQLSGDRGSDDKKIEGYLEWCELDIRSRISGQLYSDGRMNFHLVFDSSNTSVILGAPEKLEWCLGMTCAGRITCGSFFGTAELTTVSTDQTPLSKQSGEMRIDETSLGCTVALTRSGTSVTSHEMEGTIVENVTVIRLDEQQCVPSVIFVEISPVISKKISLPNLHFPSTSVMPRESGNFKQCPDPDAILADESSYNCQLQEGLKMKHGNCADDIDSFGLCNVHDNMWVEWNVAAVPGEIVFGVTTLSTASSVCTQSNQFGIWSYSSTGLIEHGEFSLSTDTILRHDKVSIHIDTQQGRIAFYRNNCFLYDFKGLKEHPEMFSVDGDLREKGLKPFVVLREVGDSVGLIKFPSATVEVTNEVNGDQCLRRRVFTSTFKTDDILGRKKLRMCTSCVGMFVILQDAVYYVISLTMSSHQLSVPLPGIGQVIGLEVCNMVFSYGSKKCVLCHVLRRMLPVL